MTLGIGSGLWMALSVQAQTLPEIFEQYRQVAPPPEATVATEDLTPVSLALPQLIELVIEGNRDLRNATLERIVQQQTLAEAESRFDPNFTPRLVLGVTERLNEDNDNSSLGLGRDRTTVNSALGVEGNLLTPLGTNLSLSIDPLNSARPLQLTLTQPLLRGFGRPVNEAPIFQARLTEQRNQLSLYQQTLELVTTAITSYTTLIQRQEAVSIQAQALVRRQTQYDIIAALVEAGRQPRIDLIEADGNIASAERDLQDAQNLLAQANTDLLNLIGSDQPIQFVADADAIEQLLTETMVQIPDLELNTLLAMAYQHRPEYISAQLDIDNQQLAVLVAEDAQRWQLDLTGTTDLGTTTTAGLGLVLTRQFENESLETVRQRSRVSLEQSENRLAQITTTIRNQVANRLADIRSNQRRLVAAQRATESAQIQLQADRELFRRGLGGITLLELIQREEALVSAQNDQLAAEIALLNSFAQLEQAVGTTLLRWQDRIDFAPAFSIPVLDDGES